MNLDKNGVFFDRLLLKNVMLSFFVLREETSTIAFEKVT